MTATQKAWFTLIYFIVMLPFSYLSRRSLWEAVCKAGGTTPKGVREKSPELLRTTSSSHSLQASFDIWMLKNAPNPKKYKRLSLLHSLCLAPNIIFAFASMTVFYTRALSTFIKIGIFVVPAVMVISLAIGIYYKRHDIKEEK